MNTKPGKHASNSQVEFSSAFEDTQEAESPQGSKTSASDKRAAQNRAAQRAFRQRKEQHIKELENKAQQYDLLIMGNEKLKIENELLWNIIGKVQSGKDIHSLSIPKKMEHASTCCDGNLEGVPHSHGAQHKSSHNVGTESSPDTQHLISTLSNDTPRDSIDTEATPYSIQRRSIGSNVLSNNTYSSIPEALTRNDPDPVNDSLKLIGPSAMVDSCFSRGTDIGEDAKHGLSNVTIKDNRISFSPTQHFSSALPRVARQSSEPPEILNSDDFNLTFLQYGWLYDSATSQQGCSGFYYEMTGTTPVEISFNDQVMDDLYSLLEFGSVSHDETLHLANLTPQYTEVVGIT